jgi:hypothetical protein
MFHRYASLSGKKSDHVPFVFADCAAQMPHAQPSPNELEEMSQRAQTVVRLLEDLNRMYLPEAEQNRDTGLPTTVGVPMQVSPEDPRPPKRPWEDISQDDNAAPVSANTSFEVCVTILHILHSNIDGCE